MRWLADSEQVMPDENDDHIPLRLVMNSPGILQPELLALSDTTFPDKTEVIGLIVDGQPLSFPIQLLSSEATHIINMVFNRTPVSITYCDLAKCARVLTSEQSTTPLDLRLGGLDDAMQMVFLYKDIRYGQESTKIPLMDFPFEKVSLGDWRLAHPDSLIYSGPKK